MARIQRTKAQKLEIAKTVIGTATGVAGTIIDIIKKLITKG